jgi:hypothetical protein
VVEGHGALQGGGAKLGRDLDRAAERGRVDAGLCGLLDDSADAVAMNLSSVSVQFLIV